MTDSYCEYLVKRKMTIGTILGRVLTVLMAILLIYLAPMYLAMFGLVLDIVVIVGVVAVFRKTSKEYEYEFVGGDLNIAVIYGKRKRKLLKKLDMHKIEIFAPLDSEKFASYDKDSSIDVLDYSSGDEEKQRYAFVIQLDEGKTAKIIIETSERMCKAIKNISPSRTFID